MNRKETMMPYRVGGLLYTPAVSAKIADKIASHAYPCLTSIGFCLEDSIRTEVLQQAEENVKQTLKEIKSKNMGKEELPLLFVRIRTPEHMEKFHDFLGDAEEMLTGYILPKFDLSNGEKYTALIKKFNLGRKEKLYLMPILESRMIAHAGGRIIVLEKIKEILDASREYILNIRVGGNDFSNLYGVRRAVSQTIYDIGVVRDILIDIINMFALDYVVSGPVWEYFGISEKEPWAAGLKRELELDRLNGFIGKTSIHPSQLPLIYESMKVTRSDYQDALNILKWTPDQLAVAKSWEGSRMNEVKCHTNWAERIAVRGDIYGIREA